MVARGDLGNECTIEELPYLQKQIIRDCIAGGRPVITATFTDNSDDKTRVALAQDHSPDLTHVRLVKAGDTLPAMCFKIYGDPRFYLEVARANGLDNFAKLVPGTRVFFPPLQK